jgi:hypothetical protein
MGRRRSVLVPESKTMLNQLKRDVMKDKVAPPEQTGAMRGAASSGPSVGGVADRLGVPYKQGQDNGDMTARQAGKLGGEIGGTMVRKLISIAQQELSESPSNDTRGKPFR